MNLSSQNGFGKTFDRNLIYDQVQPNISLAPGLGAIMKKEDNLEGELLVHDLMTAKFDPKERLKSERAFRRGFHHGWVLGKEKNSKITEEDIYEWRFRYPLKKDFSPLHLTREQIQKGIKERKGQEDKD